jgi:hypothetical protein
MSIIGHAPSKWQDLWSIVPSLACVHDCCSRMHIALEVKSSDWNLTRDVTKLEDTYTYESAYIFKKEACDGLHAEPWINLYVSTYC